MCFNVKLSSVKSHHTNLFAHIIIKFKNKKVSSFFKMCGSLQQPRWYIIQIIILLPIRIDSVMICRSKSIEISKDMVTGSLCATSN